MRHNEVIYMKSARFDVSLPPVIYLVIYEHNNTFFPLQLKDEIALQLTVLSMAAQCQPAMREE